VSFWVVSFWVASFWVALCASFSVAGELLAAAAETVTWPP